MQHRGGAKCHHRHGGCGGAGKAVDAAAVQMDLLETAAGHGAAGGREIAAVRPPSACRGSVGVSVPSHSQTRNVFSKKLVCVCVCACVCARVCVCVGR